MANYETVFSEFEVRELGFKIGENETILVPCIGTVEEEREARTVTKKCRGVVKKTVTMGTGSGTLKVTAHVPLPLVRGMFGIKGDGLKEGVYAYGQNSRHAPFVLTADVFNEDGDEMLRAYPSCVVKSNYSNKVENGAEEVAELELEIAFMPDDEGEGVYETVVSELGSDASGIKTGWMKTFNRTLVEAAG